MTILSGPINIKQVVEFIQSTKKAFYRTWEGKPVQLECSFWKPENIIITNFKNLLKYYDEGESLYQLVKKCDDLGLIDRIKPLSSNFAVDIFSFSTEMNYSYSSLNKELVTSVYDKTILDDLITGQTFAPLQRDFVITNYNFETSSLYNKMEKNTHRKISIEKFNQEWNDYLSQQINEAQKRISGSVSKVAYNIVNDLHNNG